MILGMLAMLLGLLLRDVRRRRNAIAFIPREQQQQLLLRPHCCHILLLLFHHHPFPLRLGVDDPRATVVRWWRFQAAAFHTHRNESESRQTPPPTTMTTAWHRICILAVFLVARVVHSIHSVHLLSSPDDDDDNNNNTPILHRPIPTTLAQTQSMRLFLQFVLLLQLLRGNPLAPRPKKTTLTSWQFDDALPVCYESYTWFVGITDGYAKCDVCP